MVLPVAQLAAGAALAALIAGCTAKTAGPVATSLVTPAAATSRSAIHSPLPATTRPVPPALVVATTRPAVPAPAAPAAAQARPRPTVERVRRFASAADVARRLVAADRELAGRGTTAARVAAAAQQHQLAIRALVMTPGWRAAALAALGEPLRSRAASDVAAGAALRLLSRPRPALPAWRIVRPEPPDALLRHYREAQRATGIHWTYLAAINLVESKMGRIRGLSTAGARGPMQFMPGTWAEVGRGDIDDPHDSIQAAARYLVRRGGLRDIAKGLRGYNNSRHYVAAVLAYAAQMRRDPAVYREYYEWQVIYPLVSGDVVLHVGFDSRG